MGIGPLIRDLRRSRNWSQGRLADEINREFGTSLDREHVSKWERNRQRVGAFYLRCLSAVLDVPLAVLENEMHRRTLLTDVAGAAIAPLVASDLLSAGFAARLQGGPDVDTWEDKIARYGTDYMSLGAADIQRRVSRELVVVQSQLDRPQLWSVAAKLMTLYAKTFPGSDGNKAVGWYRMAAQAADESADTDTRVWVRGRAAIALGYEGASLGVADMLAQQAREIADGRPSLGLLNAIYGEAHAAAIRGDRDRARALDVEGRRVFDSSGSDDVESDYAVPHWRLNVFRSLLHARLGSETEAIAAQDTARKELPASLPRFATHLELHRALMLARAGDNAGGIEYAERALNHLPPERHSLTLRMLMDEIKAGR